MDWSVYAAMPRLTITPGYSELWHEDATKLLVIEPEDSITVKKNGKSYAVPGGFMAIGSAIAIANHSPKPVTVKLTALAPKDKKQLRTMRPLICDKTESEFRTFAEALHAWSERCPDAGSESVGDMLTALLQKFNLPKPSPAHGRIDPRLIWIHRTIRMKYREPLTLEGLADSLQCNPVYLSNTYSKVFHCSPMKHLQRVRVDKARQLLADTDLSINDITLSVGYISRSQLAAYFKKHYGVTPSEYRMNKSLREADTC